MQRKLFLFMMLFTATTSFMIAEDCNDCPEVDCPQVGQAGWLPRAFSSYKTREMFSMCCNQDSEKDECLKGFSLAAEYMHSFGDSEARLGSLPFWSGTNTMTIGTNNGESSLDAYQFGLGQVSETGSITLSPVVHHVGGDFMWRWTQYADKLGMYMKLKLPVGSMIVDPRLCEDPAVGGAVDEQWMRYPAVDARFKSLSEAFHGGRSNTEPDYQYGKIAPCRRSVTRVGDLEFVVGASMPTPCDRGSFGLGFKFSGPTGNVPTAEYMLEPIFGRGGHWAVGGEFHGQYKVWEGDDCEMSVKMLGDVLHLTSGRRPHMRSFDLARNGKGSRYMLVQQYVVSDYAESGTVAEGTYTPSVITPAINITTLPVHSEFSVEGSFALMLEFKKENWDMSLTGEFWGRSQEKLSIDTNMASGMHLNDYAVLGRQISEDNRYSNGGISLMLCEPAATINKSENRVYATADSAASTTACSSSATCVPLPTGSDPDNGLAPLTDSSNTHLPFIPGTTDYPCLSTQLTASACPSSADYDTDKIKDARDSANRIPADPEVALDICGAQLARAFSGKVTAEIGYEFELCDYKPRVSVFGGVEIADKTSKSLSFWSVGLQGSLQF